jgi:hypothetical protein
MSDTFDPNEPVSLDLGDEDPRTRCGGSYGALATTSPCRTRAQKASMRVPRISRHPTIRLEGRLEGCHRGSNQEEVHAGVSN